MEGSVEKDEQWGRLGVEWADPKELIISGDTLKDEEQDHSCSEGSDKTCRSKRPGHF